MVIRRGRAGGGGSEKEARHHRWPGMASMAQPPTGVYRECSVNGRGTDPGRARAQGPYWALRLRNKDASSYQPRGTASRSEEQKGQFKAVGKVLKKLGYPLRGCPLSHTPVISPGELLYTQVVPHAGVTWCLLSNNLSRSHSM